MPNLPAKLKSYSEVLDNPDAIPFMDPQEAGAAIAARILSAESADDVLTMAGTLSADDVLGKPFVLRDFRFMKSAHAEGSPVYALIEAAMIEDGEVVPITCGGRNVCAQIARLADLKALPVEVKLVRTEKPTANGFYPLWLTKP